MVYSCIYSLIMPSGDFGGNTEIEYHTAVYSNPSYSNSEIYSADFDSSFERQDQGDTAPQRQLTESNLKTFRYGRMHKYFSLNYKKVWVKYSKARK